MQTRCKCVANIVNAVFTSLLHRACKCVSKYGPLTIHLKLTIHNASEAISAEFLRLRKTRALYSGLK